MTETKPKRQRRAKRQPQELPEVSKPEPLQTKAEAEEQRKQEIRDKRYLPIMKVGQNFKVKGPTPVVNTVGLGKLKVTTYGGTPNV